MVHFEEKIEDFPFVLSMLPNTPAPHALQALFKMREQILEIVTNAHKLDAPKDPEEPKEVSDVV